MLRVYAADETVDADGYPLAWCRIEGLDFGIKDVVRASAGHRCVRCGHPYTKGEHGDGQWTPCDSLCSHPRFDIEVMYEEETGEPYAMWRILTVHHVNGVKTDCRWWNLLSLCQRCHLRIQGRVILERAFIFEHSNWFKPYAAAWYSLKYLSDEIAREEAISRQDELLGFERLA